MNAAIDAAGMDVAKSSVPRTPPHPTHKLKLLLRREFWEHKGGFFWAPIWAGGISLLLTLMGIVVALVAGHRAANSGKLQIDGMEVNGLDLGVLTRHLKADDVANFGQGLDMFLRIGSSWPFVVMAFVVFFYAIGALYDERKDRSVLFWKSLPVSDAHTVLSKAASALVIAPVVAALASIATLLGLLLMLSVVTLAYGGNPLTLVWNAASPFTLIASSLTWIPVFTLWALPTVGWLLLCSAWSKSKPFLWAIMIPVLAGIFNSWFDVMELFNLDSGWFWGNIVGRLLGGTIPGIDFFYRQDLANFSHGDNFKLIHSLLSPTATFTSLQIPSLWIGAGAGIAMIAAAIRLRRWRDDN